MKHVKHIKYSFLLLGYLVAVANGVAQDPIRKEVRVVKPYEPSLSDAFKIALLPEMDDTIQYTPDYTYSISPRSFRPDYQVRPINPARMLGEPLPKLYNSFLKLGFGNYTTPYGELHINNLRSKEHSVGAYAKHISSQGKVTLDNGEEVFGGYSDSEVSLYGKKFLKNSILSGSAGLGSDQVYYYGYDTEVYPDTVLEKEDIKQSFLLLTGNARLKSSHADSTKLFYDLQLNYDYFSDKFKMTENGFHFDSRFSKLIRKQDLGTDLSFHYLDKSEDIDSTYNAILKIAPWFARKTNQWRLKAGLNLSFDILEGNTTPHIYPEAELQFKVIENLLSTYLGVDGQLELNHYKKITAENPFVVPGLNVRNTDHKMIIYGGFLGNISQETSFKIRASYSLIDDMYFFVNDTLNPPGNQFIAEYDDVGLKTLYAEIVTKPTEKFTLILKGAYFNYTMSGQDKPWHKPPYDLTFSAKYNLRNKILVTVDLYGEGKRYAKEYGPGGSIQEIELDGLIDLNFGIEYRYTKLLSAFLNFNNINSARYSTWNRYPSQRFFFMVGFTYAM